MQNGPRKNIDMHKDDIDRGGLGKRLPQKTVPEVLSLPPSGTNT